MYPIFGLMLGVAERTFLGGSVGWISKKCKKLKGIYQILGEAGKETKNRNTREVHPLAGPGVTPEWVRCLVVAAVVIAAGPEPTGYFLQVFLGSTITTSSRRRNNTRARANMVFPEDVSWYS